MTPFDVKFFNLMKMTFAESHAVFPDQIASAEDFAHVQWCVGYRQALIDIEERGEEIVKLLNGGED